MTTQSYEKKFYINVNITGLFYDTPDTESAESIAVGKFLAADVECIDCSCQWGKIMLALILLSAAELGYIVAEDFGSWRNYIIPT